MYDDYLKSLLQHLQSEQASDEICCSDDYLKSIKLRIEQRAAIIKELSQKIEVANVSEK